MSYHLPEEDDATTSLVDDDVPYQGESVISASFSDRLTVLAQLASLYRKGMVSPEVIDAWKIHVADNRADKVSDCPDGVCSRVDIVPSDNRQALFKGPMAQFFRRNPVRVTESLGEHVRAIFFTGPRVNTIVLSSDVVSDRTDMTFQAMEFFMHYATGQMKGGTYDFIPEFRRDRPVPTEFLSPRYGEFEGKVRKITCCLWDDTYSESMLDSPFIRTALSQPGLNPQVMRAIVRDKESFRAVLVSQLLQSSIVQGVRNRIHVPPVYGGPIAVVKAPDDVDINVYLLQQVARRDSNEVYIRRRWIPSETILSHLGISLNDVARISWEQLMSYEEDTILIHPAEVEELRNILASTVTYAHANVFLSGRARLRGSLFSPTIRTSDVGIVSRFLYVIREKVVTWMLRMPLTSPARVAMVESIDGTPVLRVPPPWRGRLPIIITPHWQR